jgi:signal transduction histidine kinase
MTALVAGAAAAAVAMVAWYTNPGAKLPLEGELARVVVGLSFVGAGVLASAYFGNRRVALLMVAVGLTWFLWDLSWIYEPLPYTVGISLGALFQPILVHLGVAFPTGYLRTRLDRWIVLFTYSAWAAFSLTLQMTWDPRVDCPVGCSTNLLLVYPDVRLHDALQTASIAAALLITVMVVAVVVRHWWTATAPARRALAPVIWSSWPMAGVLTAYSVAGRDHMPVLSPIVLTALPIGFLVGLLRMQLTRAAVGRLIIELGQQPTASRLREALAGTLRDPELDLVFWNRERSTFVDLNGQSVDITRVGAGRVATVLQGEPGPIAALVHDAALREDPELIEATAAAARLAIENERLQAEIRAQLQEVRASRARLVEASDAARRQLERDLHDGSQQRLVTLAVQLSLAQARLGNQPDPELASLLAEALEDLRTALDELRQLARGIHPAVLTQAGLGPALASLAERSPAPVTILEAPEDRLPTAVESTVYFVVAESLTNAARYAKASAVTVRATQSNGHIRVEVVDDGVGGADLARGSGLQGLADRVGALDGTLEVASPPGGGTKVIAVIPHGVS